MNYHLSEQLRYLESHQKEFEKLITEVLASDYTNVQIPAITQAYQVLKEVEQILTRKFKVMSEKQSRVQGTQDQQPQDINFVYEKLLVKVGSIAQQSDNIYVLYNLLRIMDIILKNRLITYENKETQNLINFINNIFLLHDIFLGTTIAKRMAQRSRNLLNYILKRKDINEDQEEEIRELLNMPNLKGSDIFNNFDQETSEIKKIIKQPNVTDKIYGLTQLTEKLTKCQSLSEQLALFSSKCQPLIKSLIRDVKENDDQIFQELSTFLLSMIFDTEYLVSIDKELLQPDKDKTQQVPQSIQLHDKENEVYFYQLTEQKEVLENCEGLYTSVALIINFFLSFPKKIDLQQTVLTVFRRLYTTFPMFRKNLEDPIIMVLINIQYKYNEMLHLQQTRSKADIEEDKKIEETYADASRFVNYLLSSDDETEINFKEKIFSRKELQQYLTAKNLEQYKPNLMCLPIVKYGDFNLRVGFPNTQEISAGGSFFQMVEVEEANSIIFCGFQTTSHDIQFAFYKITQHSEVASEDDIQHNHLEEIFQQSKIESHPNFVKVSFIAKSPGIYKIFWNNDHSWFKAKTLHYRISVLKPISTSLGKEGKDQDKFLVHTDKESILEDLSLTKRKSLQQMIDIPKTVIKYFTNIDESTKRRELQNTAQYEEQIFLIQIDLDYETIKLSTKDIETEVSHELGQTDDLAFILDENLHSYLDIQKQIKKPTNKNHTKLFISLSKSERSMELLQNFNYQQIKFIKETYYDIYIIHDCDVAVYYMALNMSENSGKSKRKFLNETAFVFIKLSDLYFESSLLMRQKLIQSENDYSYEIGNIGSLDIMTEVISLTTSDTENQSSSDEASGNSHMEQSNGTKEINQVASKSFALKQLRDIWKDPKALAIALGNLQKIFGIKLNVMLSLNGQEGQKEKEHMQRYCEEVVKDIKDKLMINVQLREEEMIMYALRSTYKPIEILQLQYNE